MYNVYIIIVGDVYNIEIGPNNVIHTTELDIPKIIIIQLDNQKNGTNKFPKARDIFLNTQDKKIIYSSNKNENIQVQIHLVEVYICVIL
jgi:hypothetical protein